MELKMVVWNSGHKKSDAAVEAKIRDYMLTHHIGIFSEMGGRVRVRNRLARDFDVLEGDGPGQSRVLIVTTERLVPTPRKGFLLINKRIYVGRRGAGPARMPFRYMPYRRYYDVVTRRWYWIAGKHMVASQRLKRRRLLAIADLVLTSLWAQAHRGLLLIGGDWNMRPDAKRLSILTRLGIAVVPRVLGKFLRTHAKAGPIDWVVYRTATRRWRVVSQTVLPGWADDHDAYSVTFDVTRRKT